jgi:hypothetical protein
MSSEQHPDFFEQSGFKYSDKTFDDLFVKKFKDVINISTESSDEEIQAPAIEEEQDQIDSSAKNTQPIAAAEADSYFDLDNSKGNQIQEEVFEDYNDFNDDDIDLEKIEPHKFNWFKYLLDKHLKHVDEEGNMSALHTADAYINLLNIVTSQKTNEEIQEELLDLVGFHNFPLLEHLINKRDAIKTYCAALSDALKDEKVSGKDQYRGKNMNMAPVSIGVSV